MNVGVFGCVVFLCLIKMSELEIFSLEEDDEFNNLFITQEPSQSVDNSEKSDYKMEVDSNTIFGLSADNFQSPCSSIVPQAQYSDISDDDVFMPSQFSMNENR